ncbi:MAG: phosphatase PAP2 family protein [Flavisolibacter sp.]|jgi:hypothetical protein
MKKNLPILICFTILSFALRAQEPLAGTWKTWFISSGKEYRLPPPASYKQEIGQVLSAQQQLDSIGRQQIIYWNQGAPGYHWQEMINKLWQNDTASTSALANMLLGVAIYDATITAWDSKYFYNRQRPFEVDNRIKIYAVKPQSPSYPCEYSVAAGVAVAVFSHFYPAMADSVNKLAKQEMASRVAAGLAFPSDAHAGFELGKKIAEKEIERTKDFVPALVWDRKIPAGPGLWKGNFAMFPLAGRNKTVVMDSASEFRPGPPPDFTKDMSELKNFKQTFRSQANAFFWASQDFWNEALVKKMFEYNLHLNPPRAARIYAIMNVSAYDAFIACFDAKYAYWGIRPDQYDTTYHSLIPTPPFPGYPSGHAVMSGMYSELLSYFFPMDRNYFQRKAKDAAESRFQAGIHFRTDNDTGLDLGRKVAAKVVKKIKNDGADDNIVNQNKTASKKL